MQASAEKIWTAAQEHLRSMLSPDTYNLWFAPLRACSQDGNGIILEVANDFCEVWLKDNYMGLLQDVVALAAGRQIQIKFKVSNAASNGSLAQAPTPAPAKAKIVEPAAERNPQHSDLNFNPKNTFDTFVVGNNNNFSCAAARQILQPAVSLRRRRPGQDSFAARHRPARVQQPERRARRLCLLGKIHERIHRRDSEQPAGEVPQEISPDG